MTQSTDAKIASLEASSKASSDLASRDRSEMRDDIKALTKAVEAHSSEISEKIEVVTKRLSEIETARIAEKAEIKGMMRTLAIFSSFSTGGALLGGKALLQFLGILAK